MLIPLLKKNIPKFYQNYEKTEFSLPFSQSFCMLINYISILLNEILFHNLFNIKYGSKFEPSSNSKCIIRFFDILKFCHKFQTNFFSCSSTTNFLIGELPKFCNILMTITILKIIFIMKIIIFFFFWQLLIFTMILNTIIF